KKQRERRNQLQRPLPQILATIEQLTKVYALGLCGYLSKLFLNRCHFLRTDLSKFLVPPGMVQISRLFLSLL
ncbi:hypothetical protein, partial [Olsenella uli]|uniref:hypothetical protein n=1 Tax=Olsenella uli TaxID=133926 RepID=UPI00195A6FF7